MRKVIRGPLRTGRMADAIAALVLAAAAPAVAQTITVNTTQDVVDLAAPQQVGNLPGPDGWVSFREACMAANNTPGPQTIEFAIPQSDWWLMNDRAILKLEDGLFPLSDDGTVVDFTTQTEFTGDTNPSGWEVGIYGLEANAWGVQAISISADNCTIKGLDRVMQRGYGVAISGNNNRVIGCTISGPLYAGVKVQGFPPVPATNNVVGGTAPGEGNVLSAGNSGVRVDGPTLGTVVIGSTLIGSRFVGVEVRGAYCCPEYTPYGTRIGGPTPEEANWIADNGQYGEEGFPEGTQVRVEWAVDTVVEGNIIGTTQAGDARYPGADGTVGVGVRESDDTVIRNNLISGIRREGVNHYVGQVFGTAISISGPNTGVVIEGNRIGTDASGLNPLPNRSGVGFGWFQGYPSGGQIGGTNAEQANLIAFNELTGIAISAGVSGVAIQGNAIHSNGQLGIDLLTSTGQSGVTPNDPGDADAGGNGLQNFPDLSAAQSDGATNTTVEGSLNSAPNASYGLEFFGNDVCDPSGFGEGRVFLGDAMVMTDAGGNAAFAVVLPAPVGDGQYVTATATDSEGNTSEFSACRLVEYVASRGDCDSSGSVNLVDFATFSNCFGLSAPGGPCDAADFACSDLDENGSVDLTDFATFAVLYTGAS